MLEEAFNIELANDVADDTRTVRDLIRRVERLMLEPVTRPPVANAHPRLVSSRRRVSPRLWYNNAYPAIELSNKLRNYPQLHHG